MCAHLFGICFLVLRRLWCWRERVQTRKWLRCHLNGDILFSITDTLLKTLHGSENGWVTLESRDWKTNKQSILDGTSLTNYCSLTLTNAYYLLRLFKVKGLSLLTLPNVSLNFWKPGKWAVVEENGFWLLLLIINFFFKVVCMFPRVDYLQFRDPSTLKQY